MTVVISGIKNVQQAYVSRTLQFRKFFFATIGGTVMSAVVGIGMAIEGYGVWALVTQKLVNLAVDTLVLWLTVKWRPKLMFSFQRLKTLIGYGWKLLASALLDTLYKNLRQLIIGKMYTETDLAFYNQGKQFPNLIITNIITSIDSVLLPIMSSEQDDSAQVKSMTRRSIKISSYVMAPLMMGLAFTAPTVVSVALTDKWLPCVPYLRIFCITFMFYPIHTANLNALKAMGRSDLFLKLEIIKKAAGMFLLLSTMWFGVLAMAYSLLLNSLASQIINAWPNKNLLKYGYAEQIRDVIPSILLSVVMGCLIFPIVYLPIPTPCILLIQVIIGMLLYIAGSIIFKVDSFDYLWRIMKPVLLRLLHRK